MNNKQKINELQALKAYYLTQLNLINNSLSLLKVLNDEDILAMDFDNDGIVSIIDQLIVTDTILERNNNNPLYNSENKTFNGKVLDINGDGTIDISDMVNAVSNVLDYIQDNIPIDIRKQGVNQYNIKDKFTGTDWIELYRSSHNGVYPTLELLREAYNQAAEE